MCILLIIIFSPSIYRTTTIRYHLFFPSLHFNGTPGDSSGKKSLKERSTHKFKSRPTSKKMRESALFPPSSLSLSFSDYANISEHFIPFVCYIPYFFAFLDLYYCTYYEQKSEMFPSLPRLVSSCTQFSTLWKHHSSNCNNNNNTRIKNDSDKTKSDISITRRWLGWLLSTRL